MIFYHVVSDRPKQVGQPAIAYAFNKKGICTDFGTDDFSCYDFMLEFQYL